MHSPLSLGTLAAGARAFLRRWDAGEFGRLEATLAERYGADSVLLTDSGTTALTLGIVSATSERPGASTALPAYACYDVATAAVGAGTRVRPYDLDPGTLGPDWLSFEAALAGGAKIVVVAYLYGLPVDVTQAQRLCDSHGAILIEDAAQCAGGRFRSRPLGSFGALSVLSFGRGKGTTGGGGGALLGRGAIGVRALEFARGLIRGTKGGQPLLVLAAQLLFARPVAYGLPASMPFLKLGDTIYRPPSAPLRMSRVSAAVLETTIPLAEAERAIRTRNAARLARSVGSNPRLRPIRILDGCEPGLLRLPLLADEGARATLIGHKARRLGVSPGYPKALPDLPELRDRCTDHAVDIPGARRLAGELFTLPTHSLLSEPDLRDIESLVRDAG